MIELALVDLIKVKLLSILDTVWTVLKHFPNLKAAESEAKKYRQEEDRKLLFFKSMLEGLKDRKGK